MTSYGTTSFTIGSAVSATGSAFSDAFESYRRAQYLFAGSAVAPGTDAEDDEFEDFDEETGFRRRILESEDEGDDVEYEPRPQPLGDDAFTTSFDWDEDQDSLLTPSMAFPRNTHADYNRGRNPRRFQRPTIPRVQQLRAMETSPLISRNPSLARSVHEQVVAQESDVKDYGLAPTLDTSLLAPPPQTLHHRSSNLSHKTGTTHYTYVGRSTYGQTLFNSIAILLGIGMLSEPLAFAYSGWIMGTVLTICYAYISCYTAKILARMILSDPRLRSYSDIGRKAFGPRATLFISLMFCLELFAVTVILVTLYGDSIHTILPYASADTYKVCVLVVLIPTVFLPLSLISYTSILGILSSITLVIVIFVDGFSKKEAPGSLFDPAPTDAGVKDLNKLGIAFGLFMAGFSGHPVIPSLARDMIDPSQFDNMINWAFGIASLIYAAIGGAGYLMFGNDVHDEISIDLLITPGYSSLVNQICLWLLVISPISKFGLNAQPLNATLEILLGLDTPGFSSPEGLAAKPDELSSITPPGSHVRVKKVLAIIQRIVVTVLTVSVSIAIPEFSSMMAFLGSFTAFMLSIVGPILAKVLIEGRCGFFDGMLVFLGIGMAVWGTLAAFWSAS
ncbi:hypothetical protein EST38_g7607 [Candolleomyces aberdarensis]|uniref:Amino acid transporter transmembrane domain-containing protein n=1 Tax=Candolleomyces aberdarensis TaxID=2316362 RepID=A0A4Q2DI11_9AGAR|nr:hypothetical protein EST38_g7607 [Candolleomyces aberdarensis]